MSKRLAIVTNTSWNIYNFRLGLLKALQEEGYHMIAIAPKDTYSEKLEALGIEYYEISMNNKGTNPLEDAKLMWDLYHLYKRLHLDAILQYTIKPNIYGSLAAKMLEIPVLSNISGLGTVFLDNRFSSKVAKFLYKVALRDVHSVLFQNSEDKTSFIQAKLVEESQTQLLPGSGINTDRFVPQELDKKSDKPCFLFIARLLRDKGIVEYVDAARILSQNYKIECYILGAYYEGNPTAILPSEMKKWEEEGMVKYLGTSDDVASHIASVDCVVLPSYREGLSRVLLEAASMAKPLITTDVPGCREVVEDGINGFLCEVKNSVMLAEKMEKMLLLSMSERQEMGLKGREKVMKEFDEKFVIQSYKKILFNIFGYESNEPNYRIEKG